MELLDLSKRSRRGALGSLRGFLRSTFVSSDFLAARSPDPRGEAAASSALTCHIPSVRMSQSLGSRQRDLRTASRCRLTIRRNRSDRAGADSTGLRGIACSIIDPSPVLDVLKGLRV